jgi:CspA family cold shock protein
MADVFLYCGGTEGTKMVTGKIIRFDENKGYGFITPDTGDDDVFVHINELAGASGQISTGTRVQFSVIDGGRGPKAYDVDIIDNRRATADASSAVARIVAAVTGAGNGNGTAAANGNGASAGAGAVNGNGHGAVPASHGTAEPTVADDDVCEIFSADEFIQRITNLLLESAPQLTGGQIVELRQQLLQFGRENGWVD